MTAQNAAAVTAFVQAPSHWRCIDFISDLHLCEAMPRSFAALEQLLQQTPADALFILGDLFELWVGDDLLLRSFEARCAQALAAAAPRLQVFFMVGNRDFLAGPQLMQAAQMQALQDPCELRAFGQRVLLSHGDAWCLNDVNYQVFRREVRSPAWQQQFLSQTLDQRLAVAQGIRSASRERQRFDGAADADVDSATAIAALQVAQAQALIHGHTHRPGSHILANAVAARGDKAQAEANNGPALHRHVLSDWDLDDPLAPRAEVLRWTPGGFQRLALRDALQTNQTGRAGAGADDASRS